MINGNKEMNEIKGKKESRAEKKRRKKEAFLAKPWYKRFFIRTTQVFIYSLLLIGVFTVLAIIINPISEEIKTAQEEAFRVMRAEREEARLAEEARKEEARLAEEARKEEARLAEESRREALTPEQREAEDRRALYQQVKKKFFTFGENYSINKAIKDQLNNPKSFDHVNTDFIITPDPLIIVTTTFRATNAFNALVLSEAIGIMNTNGVVFSVEIQ